MFFVKKISLEVRDSGPNLFDVILTEKSISGWAYNFIFKVKESIKKLSRP